MQKSVTKFTSECGKAEIYVDNDTPIGQFHDFLTVIKGFMIDRMVSAHQEDAAKAKEAMKAPIHESELPHTSEKCCLESCEV